MDLAKSVHAGRHLPGGADEVTTPGKLNLQSYASLKSAVSGGYDWSAAMTQLLADCVTRNIRRITIPDVGVPYYFTSGFTIPANYKVKGLGLPLLDFSQAGNVAYITQSSASRLSRFEIKGNGKANTATAIVCNGSEIRANDLLVHDVGTGWSGVNNNTYITTVTGSHFYNCGIIIDERVASSSVSGEKIRFVDCTLADSDHILMGSGSALDMYFEGCSLDYSVDFGDMNNGYYRFTDCHLETNTGTTTQGFLFAKRNGAHASFIHTHFFMSGISLIIDRSTEGTSGAVTYQNCTAFYTKTAGGSAVVTESEILVFAATGATTATFDCPWISRTVRASVANGFHSGQGSRAILEPAVSFAASSTLGTCTWASALPGNTNVLVRFG